MPLNKTETRVTLSHPNGSTAEVLLYGATVISWKSPSQGKDLDTPKERLFVSSKAVLDGSKPVRGGIPVVFPFFGPPTKPEHAKIPQHGFARSSNWAFDSVVMDNEAGVSVKLALHPTASTVALHDFPWQLQYVITLAGHQLTTDLNVINTSTDKSFSFQSLLHTYLAAESSSVRITPLTSLTYVDKVKGGAEDVESRSEVDVLEFTDRVYKSAGGQYDVKWNGGHINVKAIGFNDVVVWNPREEGKKMGDMEDGGWDRFVCVEPGAASYWIDIAPGSTWRGQQVLTAL